MGEDLLRQLGLGEQHLGFTMVALNNEFWREQVQAVDFKRRLLLLPHCLKHAEGCPADYDEFGLDCRAVWRMVERVCHCRRRRSPPKREESS